MSSILTNTGAMVALQTMRNINRGMETVQNQISTGLKIGSAKDNSATWAISKVMESDVAGFRAIKENLSLGSSTVNVARNAAETTTKLLTEIKEKIVQAQEENVDRGKIQADIEQLRGQIASVTGAAQFNGLNLVDNFRTETVLSSLDRSSGQVTASRINVDAQDLTMREQEFGGAAARTGDNAQAAFNSTGGTLAAAATQDITLGGTFQAGTGSVTIAGIAVSFEQATDLTVSRNNLLAAIQANDEIAALGVTAAVEGASAVRLTLSGEARFGITVTGAGAGTTTVTAAPNPAATAQTLSLQNGGIQSGDSFRVAFGSATFDFVANERSTQADVLSGLAERINQSSGFVARIDGDGNLQIAQTATATQAFTTTRASGGTAAGGLDALRELDVADFSNIDGFAAMTDTEQRAAIRDSLQSSLDTIETMIQTSINAASAFGQVEKRIEIQQDFVGSLMDSLRSGIGSLVDADMEEASARLQALQVQQQLGIQALSIANQQPQNILALFR